MALDTWRTPSIRPADAVEHVVDRLGELVELVAAAATAHPLREVAGGDGGGGGGDVGQGAAEQAAHQQRAGGGHAPTIDQRPQQRVGQQGAELGAHLHVAADQQVEAARQVVALHPGQRR